MSWGGIQDVQITQLFQSLLAQPDVTVYVDGTRVVAKDKENNVIAQGTFNTDDATVIQAALDELTSGGICLVKAGTYIIGTALSIPGNVILEGVGVQTVLKCKDSTQVNVVAMPNANATIANLKIDGNKANNTDAGTGTNQNGIYCTGTGCNFIDLTVENTEQSGIYISGNNKEKEFILNAIISGCGASGILLIGGVSHSDVIGCRVQDCAHVGIRIETTSNGNRVNNCFAKGCTYGFLANQSNDNIFSNCIADDNDLTNIGALYSVGFYTTNAEGNIFADCVAKNNAGIGFFIELGSGQFFACVAHDNGRRGFGTLDDTTGSIFVGCRAYNNGRSTISALERSGFGLEGARNCVIMGCKAYDNDTSTQILAVTEADSGSTTAGNNLIIGGDFHGYAGNPDPGMNITGTLAGSKTQWHGTIAKDAIAAITPSGSPYNYQNPDYHDSDIIVQGGTVSLIEYSRDGTTYYDVGVVAGKFRLGTKEYLRVTYSVAPTMTKVPF